MCNEDIINLSHLTIKNGSGFLASHCILHIVGSAEGTWEPSVKISGEIAC